MVYLLPIPHPMAKAGASEGVTHKKKYKHPNPLVGYHDLGAPNGTKTFLGVLAVRLSPREPKDCSGLR